jgi:arylsulfatase A-like enzyme
MRTSIVAVFLVGVVALSAMAFYRVFLRDLPMFQPKPSGQVATPERPNVVLITVDSLRADHLGAYGYDPDVSPNLDELARRGIVFDQAIAQSSWTVPSTASFLTGLHPTELGIYYQRALAADLGLDQMRVTLAEVLRQNGYRTQALVTNQLVTARDGFFQGFDNYVYARPGYAFDRYRMHEEPLVGWMCRLAIGGRKPLCAWFDWGYTLLFDPWLVPNNHGERVNHYVQRFLKLHKDERFFLWLFYMEPHINYDPKQPFRPLPAEISPQRERFLRYLYMWDLSGEELLRPVDTQALLSLYDGEIVDVDALIGQVMDELEQKGLLDRTVVIFTADHGEEFMDHGDFTHGHTLYDELVRVPLIVSGLAVGAPGRTVETQVSLLDLVPTVCDIAGAPIPEEVEGRSLVPLLRGEEMEELPAFSEVLHTTIFQKKSIRHDGYKLIYDIESEAVELYDVRDDPGEQVDLAEQEPEIVARMMTNLEAWMVHSAQVAAELPRQRPLSETLDEETRQRLRNAGY